jgi:putative RNA 2'-phosphotransferase
VDRSRAVRISKLLSLGLRHDPAALGVERDPAGWASTTDVLRGLDARGEAVTAEDLVEIVATNDKQRFALSPDRTKIRANQGHSLDATGATTVNLGLERREPPEVLYHGTVRRFLDAIRREGLSRQTRTHVHLSTDIDTARIVARRRSGERVILTVKARAMHDAGHAFVLSENGVWLTEAVPPEFLETRAVEGGVSDPDES